MSHPTLSLPRLVLSGLVVGTLVLGGCSSTQKADPAAEQAAALAGLKAAELIGEAAQRAAQAQEELARIQAARTVPLPKPVAENLEGVPEGLRRIVTLEWTGPAEEAARRMAALMNYDYRVIGNPSATPVIVNISKRDVAAVKVLEDIGLQAQPFGQVVADARTKRIEFRYLTSTERRSTVVRTRY